MNRIEREKLVLKISQDIDNLLRNYDTIEANCGQLVCNEDSCEGCSVKMKLRFLEAALLGLRQEADELLIEANTWSYTIMGNRKAGTLFRELFYLVLKALKDGERDQYLSKLPDTLINNLISRCYERLVSFASSQNSHLVYQVLGVLLMKYGARMTEDVRKLILKYSRWEDEESQLIDKRDREEREMYLLDFQKRVKKYKEGVKVKVPIEILNDVMDKHEKDLFFERDSIDYKIGI